MASRESLVREFSMDTFLVCNVENGPSSSFNLICLSSNVCRTMYVTGLEVEDMEVVGDMAYFCGKWTGKAVAGWFNIYGLFFGGDVINYFGMPSSLSCSIPYSSATETILSLDRLEVVDFGNDYSHLVMIGSAICSGVSTPTQCIVELFYNGQRWMIAYQVEHSDIFHYDDISVTATNVVVVGHKKDSSSEYITDFGLSTINQDMFTNTTGLPFTHTTYASSFPAYLPHINSEILIDDIPGTSYFATVCQAMDCSSPGSWTEGTYFNLYSNTSSVIFRCRINDYHDRTYRELKYNKEKNSFLLLMEDCNTNLHNGYYEFLLDNTHSFVTDVYFHNDNNLNKYVSIDRYTKEYAKKQSVLTGYNADGDFVVWKHDLNKHAVCSETKSIPLNILPTYSTYFNYDYHNKRAKITMNMYIDTVYIKELTKICIDD